MSKRKMPNVFSFLLSKRFLSESDIMKTSDDFFLAYKSLSDILAENGVYDFLDSEGERLICNRFFDDWFMYAVPDETDYVYSLLKLREQEHDAANGLPADGDTPGVTISFISFAFQTLLDCLAEPNEENRKKLNYEINRVVAYRKQNHHRFRSALCGINCKLS